MLKPTQTTLTRLEEIFKDNLYKIRYEKGNFRSGSCKIESDRVIVINKFASIDIKINFLLEALKTQELDENKISEKNRAFFMDLKQTSLSF